MKELARKYVQPYAKAWLALVLPITVPIVADAVAAASVDATGYTAFILFAIGQSIAVYRKSNVPRDDA